ncbi:SH3 domain-containing protein [Stappia sp. ES.058]|uniref:SH3 domain-containing protein n=1 Tax=Stappia sp. ES.058 TaxID=1881061 RepID=UPI00087CF588|nr:SH3 domain-containing protein [Stappia sp. ES.058]SDU41992.1 SH3-like domain-containing protein [Stappia sp. ES.058]
MISHPAGRIGLVSLLAFFLVAAVAGGSSLAQSGTTGASGFPVPRFVSLKSDRVNVRVGPSRDHRIGWTFVRAGLPVEIVQEFENWRRIRDWEGSEGWVFHSLLTGRRTALVTPWESDMITPLREDPRSDARVVAKLSPKVLSEVGQCGQGWCEVSGNGFAGWIDQTRLFGVYPDETVE